MPEEPEKLQIEFDEIPDPRNIPFDQTALLGKSKNYVSTYKIAFTDAYINAYKIQFKNAVENYNTRGLPSIPAGEQQPGETYHIESERYGVDGIYTLNIQDTAEFYEFEPEGKTVIVIANDLDTLSVYRADDAEQEELESGAYLQYTSLDDSSNLVVLAKDIDSGDVIVTLVEDVEPTTSDNIESTTTDELVEPTPEDTTTTEDVSQTDDEVEPTF